MVSVRPVLRRANLREVDRFIAEGARGHENSRARVFEYGNLTCFDSTVGSSTVLLGEVWPRRPANIVSEIESQISRYCGALDSAYAKLGSAHARKCITGLHTLREL